MKVTICDNCGKRVKEYIMFNIWHQKFNDNGESLSDDTKTPILDYCEECFGKILQQLNLEEE